MSADERNRQVPFVHQLLAALAKPVDWNSAATLTVQLCLESGGASAGLLISPLGPEQLELIYGRSVPNSAPHLSRSTIDAPFSVLLDQSALIDCIAESGLIGGINVRLLLWTDLCAAMILQMPEEPSNNFTPVNEEDIAATCRLVLSRVTDRPIRVPNHGLLEAMAEYAAGAGHEINNPLGSIIGQTQLLLKQSQSVEHRQACETIGAQAWRIRDMIGNSMLFARPPLLQKKRINLVTLLQQILQPLTQAASDEGITIKLASTSDEIMIEADSAQFGTLIGHLVRNSIEAVRSSGSQGAITVTLRDDVAGCVELSVSDDGPGIGSDEVLRNLFNPFYSGRAAGRGLGFGLCLAWQIVRLHDGLLLHDSPEQGGTAFHLAFRTTP
jgi:signal transduction histidine kinase